MKQLFDDYSSSFESSLKSLVYNVPSLIADAAVRTYDQYSLIVDLGCGTGLLGPLVRPHTEYLIGVDLSPRMLAIAEEEKGGVYDHLFSGEMVSLLTALSSFRHRQDNNNINPSTVRRKLSGGIIRDVDSVTAEGFGGAFLGGNRLDKGKGKDSESGSGSDLPLLVTAADVFGK